MDGILDPVLQITLEFHELYGESFKVLLLKLGSFEALVPSPPQSPASVVSGGALRHNSEAYFAKELCGLPVSLKAPWRWQKHCMCLGGKGFRGFNQKDGELSQQGNYEGEKEKEGRKKESFGSFLSDEHFVGCPFVDLLCVVVF
jgi:hypothetical protein